VSLFIRHAAGIHPAPPPPKYEAPKLTSSLRFVPTYQERATSAPTYDLTERSTETRATHKAAAESRDSATTRSAPTASPAATPTPTERQSEIAGSAKPYSAMRPTTQTQVPPSDENGGTAKPFASGTRPTTQTQIPRSTELGGTARASTPTTRPSASAPSGSYYDPSYRPPVGEHYVNGYVRKDGTYVSGHYQTNPDKSFWNNYSSKGNVNPHTGKVGSRRK
jgi:hypothetical protein